MASKTKFLVIMNQVVAYARHKQLPLHMKNRLLAYYQYRFRNSYFHEKSLLANLSGNVQLEAGKMTSELIRMYEDICVMRSKDVCLIVGLRKLTETSNPKLFTISSRCQLLNSAQYIVLFDLVFNVSTNILRCYRITASGNCAPVESSFGQKRGNLQHLAKTHSANDREESKVRTVPAERRNRESWRSW